VRGGAKEGSVYKQPETEVDDSCHKLGEFQVSRRGTKGKKGEERGFGKGRLKAKGNAPCIVYVVIMFMCILE
jgi:hypothetical protein